MQTTTPEIIEFTDAIVAYHQYADELELTEAQARRNPHTQAEFLRAAEVVKQDHELQVAYTGLAADRKRGRENSLEVVKTVERSLLNGHFDTEHIDSNEFNEQLAKLDDEDWLREKAELFVGVFGSVIAKDLIPASLQPVRANKKPVRTGPRQARTISVDISEHGTIGVNGTYLRKLSPVQKFIILAGLKNEGGFRNVDIYGSTEFRKLFGAGKTPKALKDLYDQEFEGLTELLHQNGVSRLVDAKRRPGEKKHHIEAHSVNDKRAVAKLIAKQQQPSSTSIFARVTVNEARPTWGNTRQMTVPAAERATGESTLSQDRIADARRITINLIESVSGAARSSVVEAITRKLSVSPSEAKSLVAEVYRLERESEHPAFVQTKEGGKRFVAVEELAGADTPEAAAYGSYFDGTQEEFTKRYGQAKCVTPDFVKYENGIIEFKGLEAAIVNYFSESGERRAVAEKTVLAYFAQRGIEVTKQELRESANVINRLAGKELFRSLAPAGRVESSKGPRIQIAGSFAKSSY